MSVAAVLVVLAAVEAGATSYDPSGVLLLIGVLIGIPTAFILGVTALPALAAFYLGRRCGLKGGSLGAAAAAAALPGLLYVGGIRKEFREDQRRASVEASCGERPGGTYLTVHDPAGGRRALLYFPGGGYGVESYDDELRVQVRTTAKDCSEGKVSYEGVVQRGLERPADWLAWDVSWSGDRITLQPPKTGPDRAALRIDAIAWSLGSP